MKEKLTHLLVRILTKFIPKDNRLIVYGGALDLFIDNTKYLFLYNRKNFKDCKHIWLTRRQEIVERINNVCGGGVLSNSLKGVWMIVRAKAVVFDNVIEFAPSCLFGGAIKIELWHGLPMKMPGYSRNENDPYYETKGFLYEKIINPHTHGDYCISTHTNLDRLFSASFHIPRNKLIRSGYPRTLIMFEEEKKREDFVRIYEDRVTLDFFHELKFEGFKKVLYMPTFRDANTNYINEAIVDWEDLNSHCAKNNIVFYLKVHRVTPMPNLNRYSNIKIVNNTIDMYPLLPMFDLLVTDYSSIQCEFALLNKPILLYTYDLEDYILRSRNVYTIFKKILMRVSNANNYEEFKNWIIADEGKFARYPWEELYEDPKDISAINLVLKKL